MIYDQEIKVDYDTFPLTNIEFNKETIILFKEELQSHICEPLRSQVLQLFNLE